MSAEAAPEATLGAEAPPEEPRLPFFFRWVLDAPVSPWWLALGIAVLHLVLFLVVGNALGFFDGLEWRGLPIYASWLGIVNLVYSLWFAWMPPAIFYLVRGAERDLIALAPALDPGERSIESLRADVFTMSRRGMIGSVAAGLFLAGLTLSLAALAQGPIALRGVAEWTVVATREIIGNVAMTVILGWGLSVAAGLSRLVRDHVRISLLELRQLAPLTRNGTRLALLWILVFSIGAPGFAIPAGTSFVVAIVLLTILGAALSAVAVVVPLLGARRLLVGQKAEELARVRRAIESARDAVLSAPSSETGTRAGARLPGLLAWEARVEAVPVWLLDLGALRRLGLYLLIPLASWVAAAFVERMVDSALS